MRQTSGDPHPAGRSRARPRAPARQANNARRAGGDTSLARHILALRQLFRLEVVVDGAAAEGHRGIELARGSATVRCRACGRSIALPADLAGAAAGDEPLYEFTPTGLRACRAALSPDGWGVAWPEDTPAAQGGADRTYSAFKPLRARRARLRR